MIPPSTDEAFPQPQRAGGRKWDWHQRTAFTGGRKLSSLGHSLHLALGKIFLTHLVGSLCFSSVSIVELKAIYHNVDTEVALGTLSWVSGGQRIQSRGLNYQWRRQSHHEHLESHTWEQGKVEVHLHPFGVSCPSGGSLLHPEARPTCCCWLYQVAQDGSWCSCLLCIPATLSLTLPSPLSNSRGLGPAPGADRALSFPGLCSSSVFSLFT